MKLVNLLQLFTAPRFLYAAEGNHAYVSLLLETFNNIVQYQYEGERHDAIYHAARVLCVYIVRFLRGGMMQVIRM